MESKHKKNGNEYSAEFKKGVVRLVLEEGRRQEEVRKEMGLASSTISTWVKQAREGKQGAISPLTKNELQELMELRKENRILKMEREILKKATAFFAKEKP